MGMRTEELPGERATLIRKNEQLRERVAQVAQLEATVVQNNGKPKTTKGTGS